MVYDDGQYGGSYSDNSFDGGYDTGDVMPTVTVPMLQFGTPGGYGDGEHAHVSSCPATVAPCCVVAQIECRLPSGGSAVDESHEMPVEGQSTGYSAGAGDFTGALPGVTHTGTDGPVLKTYDALLVGWDTCGCPMICCPESGSLRHLDPGETVASVEYP